MCLCKARIYFTFYATLFCSRLLPLCESQPAHSPTCSLKISTCTELALTLWALLCYYFCVCAAAVNCAACAGMRQVCCFVSSCVCVCVYVRLCLLWFLTHFWFTRCRSLSLFTAPALTLSLAGSLVVCALSLPCALAQWLSIGVNNFCGQPVDTFPVGSTRQTCIQSKYKYALRYLRLIKLREIEIYNYSHQKVYFCSSILY